MASLSDSFASSKSIKLMLETHPDLIHNTDVRNSLLKFLGDNDGFDFRAASCLPLLAQLESYGDIPTDKFQDLSESIKQIQRIALVSPNVDAMAALLSRGIRSAHEIANIPRAVFLKSFDGTLSREESLQIHDHASATQFRVEQTMANLRLFVQGTGLAAVDNTIQAGPSDSIAATDSINGFATTDFQVMDAAPSAQSSAIASVNLENMFADMSKTACDDCNSITSPAAYFVDLLKFLSKSSILLSDSTSSGETLLTKLGSRRPDLPELELTCENTNTVLPYVDLVNEIMESFIDSGSVGVHNVVGKDLGPDLLASPAYTNYGAYLKLSRQFLPLISHPYNQPLDSMRILLRYLGVTRYELLDSFQDIPLDLPGGLSGLNPLLSQSMVSELSLLKTNTKALAAACEYLGFTEMGYMFLTKQSFFPKKYWDILGGSDLSVSSYRETIGLPDPFPAKLFGPGNLYDLGRQWGFLDTKFLPSFEITLSELTELLKTRFINPSYPQGPALVLMEKIKPKFNTLQLLINFDYPTSDDRRYLGLAQKLVADEVGDEATCKLWAKSYFEGLGSAIVLNKRSMTTDGVSGYLICITQASADRRNIGTVSSDGTISFRGLPFHPDEMGFVKNASGKALWSAVRELIPNAVTLKVQSLPIGTAVVRDMAYLDDWGRVRWSDNVPGQTSGAMVWGPEAANTGDPDAFRLTHLDDTPVTDAEYDKMIQFVKVWKKLDFSMAETDGVLGASSMPSSIGEATAYPDVTKIADIKRLVEKSGLDVLTVIIFWNDIEVKGEGSLFARLFLRHGVKDPVFDTSKHENFLAKPASMLEHLPAILSAFRISRDGYLVIKKLKSLSDELNMANLSVLYRYKAFSSSMGLSLLDMPNLESLLGYPFANPKKTLEVVEFLNSANVFDFATNELLYLVGNIDDSKNPLGPSRDVAVAITKTLSEGLLAIESQYPKITTLEAATTDAVEAYANLIFDKDTADRLKSFLELGVGYAGLEGGFSFLKDTLDGVFPNVDFAKNVLLSSTFNPLQSTQADVQDLKLLLTQFLEPQATPDMALVRRFYFLKYFVLFVRQQVEDTLIQNTITQVFPEWDAETIRMLLLDVLGPLQNVAALRGVKQTGDNLTSPWVGYLLPQTSDMYALSAQENNTVTLDKTTIQLDPSLPYEVALAAGKSYDFSGNIKLVQWKTTRSPKASIPISAILSKELVDVVHDSLRSLRKLSMVAKGFSLSLEELSYFLISNADFSYAPGQDGLSLEQFKKFLSYAKFRNTIPKTEYSLPALFNWVKGPFQATSVDKVKADLAAQITLATQWDTDKVTTFLALFYTGRELSLKSLFTNEQILVKLAQCLSVSEKTGGDLVKLASWAQPVLNFDAAWTVADSMRHFLASKLEHQDWEQASKQLNDELRINQRDALSAYLVQDPTLTAWGVSEADDLFDYFLIDVQMGSCLETSRIKQAIASIQLFVQRCLLGLEETRGIPKSTVDRDTWDIFSSYRIWEANRKVFLYPENWLEPSLRDDKSPQFKALESTLLQQEVNNELVQSAVKQYIYALEEISDLHYVSLLEDLSNVQMNNKSYTLDYPKVPKLHLWARTAQSPYHYYYRYMSLKDNTWHPWEKMNVEIPILIDATSREAVGNIVFPFTINRYSRLVLLVPKFTLITVPYESVMPGPTSGTYVAGNLNSFGGKTQMDTIPQKCWKIELGWTEYQDGKWSTLRYCPQAGYSVAEKPPTATDKTWMPSLKGIQLIQTTFNVDDDDHPTASFAIVSLGSASQLGKLIGYYKYTDGHLISTPTGELPTGYQQTEFRYRPLSGTQYRLHGITRDDYPPFINHTPQVPRTFQYKFTDYVHSVTPAKEARLDGNLFNASIGPLVTSAGGSNELDEVFKLYTSLQGDQKGSMKSDTLGRSIFTATSGLNVYHELMSPYSLYHWEIGCHLPLLLMDCYLRAQQFELAMKMANYIFDPLADGSDATRMWKWPPFKESPTKGVLQSIFDGLANAGSATDTPAQIQVQEWRDNPLMPHVIARSRPVAYMKWIAMKYIEILVAYGDSYFRRNTLESVPSAIQLYIQAAHLYGPRQKVIPEMGVRASATYSSLSSKWDDFANAAVEMELQFPFSNQGVSPNNATSTVSGIFGTLSSGYFCLPDNPKVTKLRDVIDDRLFKIRHCLDIDGNPRKLALWEPPIDPGLLIGAKADGGQIGLSNFMNDLDSPMPNYRFTYLIQKAFDLCTQLKSFSASLLSVKERKDSEALQALRAEQEAAVNSILLDIKNLQLEEASNTLSALRESRKGPAYRLRHFQKLIGEDSAGVPGEEDDYAESPDNIETPSSDELRASANEVDEMNQAAAAHDLNTKATAVQMGASLALLFPTISENADPMGVGVTIQNPGGDTAGKIIQVAVDILKLQADSSSFKSQQASRKAALARQYQDRRMQANNAGYELKSIDAQIQTELSRIETAKKEIAAQQQHVDDSQAVEDFLRSKYTNTELYSWLEGSTQTLSYQTYTAAYDLAKRAEKAFNFERGAEDKYIQYGYWESSRNGILSGERLYLDLKRLESAYQETRGYDFEITKNISLRQLAPKQLVLLRQNGICQVDIPESLFDADFPGHYQRRLKSVSLTIPCIVGPYTSINCTLRLLKHKYRFDNSGKDATTYRQTTDAPDARFRTTRIPIDSIAVSHGLNDSGCFQLNFHDERYIPFEGAGAVSTWELELPTEYRQFEYDSIADIVFTLQYTSRNGGPRLKRIASDSLKLIFKDTTALSQEQGLYQMLDLKAEFGNEWRRFTSTASTAGTADRSFPLGLPSQRLPYFVQGAASSSRIEKPTPKIVMVYPVAAAAIPSSATFKLVSGEGAAATTTTLIKAGSAPSAIVYSASGSDLSATFDKTWTILVSGASGVFFTNIFAVVKYVIE